MQLLNRTTRGLSPTAIGESVYQKGLAIQDQLNNLFESIALAQDEPSGRFAITYPYAFEQALILPAIAELCQDYPKLEPELLASDEPLDLVQHDLDLAIRIGTLKDSSYRAMPIGEICEVFCATPLFHHQQQTTDRPSRWIATSWQNSATIPANKTKKPNQTLSPSMRVNTLNTALQLTLSHVGFALLPDFIAKSYLKTGELIQIYPTYQGQTWYCHSMHAYHQEKPIHLSRFQQLLQLEFERLTH